MSSNRRQGFTLLELLVSVAIFSGLAVLTIGIFARSAISSLKSGASRERTEAARSVVDRINSDLRYVYTDEEVTNPVGDPNCVGAGTVFMGYDFSPVSSPRCVKMILKIPRQFGYTYKIYSVEPDGMVLLTERRGCTLTPAKVLDCAAGTRADNLSILNDKYRVELVGPTSVFDGINPSEARTGTPPTTPYLKTALTIKPADLTAACAPDNKSKCYTVSTTITTGAMR